MAAFSLNLNEGWTTMQSWFFGDNGEEMNGKQAGAKQMKAPRSGRAFHRRAAIASAASLLAGGALRGQSGASAPESRTGLLAPPRGRAQVVIDTDTFNEIDDQYAVVWALQSQDRMDVEAIYAAPFLNQRVKSAGEGMEKSYEEILKLLKFLGRTDSARVDRGSDRFMQRAGRPVESPAMRDLISRALKPREGPLYVLALGCPVNVSSAILAEPKVKEKIVVVWLGGASHEWPSAREFNLQQDLHSSRVLFDSGVPLLQIPTKNVSEHLRTSVPEMRQWLKGRSKLCDFLLEEFEDYYREETKGKPQPYPWSKVIWDISVIAWMINPEWVPSRRVASPRLTDDMRWEKDSGRHSIQVATDALRDPIFFDLFSKLART